MNRNTHFEPEYVQVVARYDTSLLEDYDELIKELGYATRQSGLVELMQKFVENEGRKRLAHRQAVKRIKK